MATTTFKSIMVIKAVKTTEKAILLQVRTSMEEEMTGKPAVLWYRVSDAVKCGLIKGER